MAEVTMQQLNDCGINPFAVKLLVESYKRLENPIWLEFVFQGVRIQLRLEPPLTPCTSPVPGVPSTVTTSPPPEGSAMADAQKPANAGKPGTPRPPRTPKPSKSVQEGKGAGKTKGNTGKS